VPVFGKNLPTNILSGKLYLFLKFSVSHAVLKLNFGVPGQIQQLILLEKNPRYRFKGSGFRVQGSGLFWTPEPLVWNSAWPEQWILQADYKPWTSNIERPTSNVQYGWRYALSILKKRTPEYWSEEFLKGRFALFSLFLRLAEYLIRCWTFNVRCSMFIF